MIKSKIIEAYIMLSITIIMLYTFSKMLSLARAEAVSVDSGTNLLITSFMTLVLGALIFYTFILFKKLK